MRRLKNRCLVPPDNFRYRHETGYTTTAPTYPDWIDASKAHLKANSLPVPADLAMKMEDQLCGIIPPDWCDREPGDVSSWVDTRFGWDEFAEGMRVFGQWIGHGTPLVDEVEAERRARICVQCPLNVGITGCATCRKIAQYITGKVAKKQTPHGDNLQACAVCKCALKAMVWFPLNIIQANESADKRAVRPDFCWAK